MLIPTTTETAPPAILETLPSEERLRQALGEDPACLPIGTRVYRAIRHPGAVVPAYVQRTYRFGPPDVLRSPDGHYPFYWMYAAEDLTTALWESQFCLNDMTQPGTFYIPQEVLRDGLVATFTLQAEIRILDLTGTVLSKLGIYDQINGHHAWCQWFGVRLSELLRGWKDGSPIGFRYPSRKHKCHRALALHSEALAKWKETVRTQVSSFADMAACGTLLADPNYADPLPGHFTLG